MNIPVCQVIRLLEIYGFSVQNLHTQNFAGTPTADDLKPSGTDVVTIKRISVHTGHMHIL